MVASLTSHVKPMIAAYAASVNGTFSNETGTHLDSHANMPVIGNEAFVFAPTGKTVKVRSWDPASPSREAPIVDAAIAYDCPYSLKTYILIIKNAIQNNAMNHNLIPPFIMREAGVEVNDAAKVHSSSPQLEDHSLYFGDGKLRIHLKLKGIFSYFDSRCPTADELEEALENSDDILYITPNIDDWDPYADHWEQMEE